MNLNINYLLNAYKEKALTPAQLIENILQRCQQFDDHNIWIHLLEREELQPYLDNLQDKKIED
ncbi:hypothetical protein MNBD_GAMMA06-1417 [hydrothermal vent metagenome]|uniref:Uncharacterized protein n=1 Tax=hydrothermal vent metagenome TaxID=652676 RepID=A0A3B0WBN5_9ZZZZ